MKYIAEADADDRNRGVYPLRYLVETDGAMGPKALANEALSASPHPLPSLWSTYSYLGDTDAFSYARKYKIKQVDRTSFLYEIDVTFMPLEPGFNPGLADVDPLSRPPVVNWSREVYTELTDQDINGDPIVNTANKRYDDPVEVERRRSVPIVEINVANLGIVLAHQATFEGALNSSAWDVFGDASFVVPQHAAICRSVDSHRQETEGGTTFFTEVYEIAIRNPAEKPATWLRRPVEQGFLHFTKVGGDFVEDADGNKQYTDVGQEPVLLAADGTKLPDGGTPLFGNWQVNPAANFNSMPFMPL
jgi:hypothetical protein